MQFSISFHQGTMTSISHNNRENVYGNPDIKLDKIQDNIYYIQNDLENTYKELFSAAVEDYNSKQKRNDRKIDDYYRKILHDTKTSVQRELIVAIGTSEDNENLSEVKKEILDQYAKEFQERNPNLKIYNMTMHLDEANPHLHINYVPFYHAQKGLSKRVANNKALKEQGVEGKSDKEIMRNWRTSEVSRIEDIGKTKLENFQRVEVGSHKYLKVPEFKEYKQEEQKLIQKVSELKVQSNELEVETLEMTLERSKLRLESVKLEDKLLVLEHNIKLSEAKIEVNESELERIEETLKKNDRELFKSQNEVEEVKEKLLDFRTDNELVQKIIATTKETKGFLDKNVSITLPKQNFEILVERAALANSMSAEKDKMYDILQITDQSLQFSRQETHKYEQENQKLKKDVRSLQKENKTLKKTIERVKEFFGKFNLVQKYNEFHQEKEHEENVVQKNKVNQMDLER